MNVWTQNFLKGLELLKPYIEYIEFVPVAKSFSNGAPDHSSSANCVVYCFAQNIWDEIDSNPHSTLKSSLLKINWRSDQEDTIWIF